MRWAFILLTALTGVLSQDDKFHNKWDGDSTVFTTSKPLIIKIYKTGAESFLGSPIESFSVDVAPTEVKGSSESGYNTLSVKYGSLKIPGSISTSSKLQSLSFNMKINVSDPSGYWIIDTMELSASGSVGDGAFNMDGALITAPKEGYSSSPADKAIGRKYRSGAPLGLSWTCDFQEFKPFAQKSKEGNLLASLVYPGWVLQTYTSNNTASNKRFGYEWDCDPWISMALWESLFIGAILLIAFLWSLSMISNLQTPNRFDDPKGKPLSVSLND